MFTTFNIVLNGTELSYATQSLFDFGLFQQTLQAAINADPQLSVQNLQVLTNLTPVIDPTNLLHLTLNNQLSILDKATLETQIKMFITQNKIGFYNFNFLIKQKN